MHRKDPARALSWLEQAGTGASETLRAAFDTWRAEILARTQRPEAAAELYRELVLRSSLTPPQTCLDAGETLIDNGHFDQAREFLLQALNLARAGQLSWGRKTRGTPSGRSSTAPLSGWLCAATNFLIGDASSGRQACGKVGRNRVPGLEVNLVARKPQVRRSSPLSGGTRKDSFPPSSSRILSSPRSADDGLDECRGPGEDPGLGRNPLLLAFPPGSVAQGRDLGHVQRVESVQVDCDGDVLLINVRQEGVPATKAIGPRRVNESGHLEVTDLLVFDAASVYRNADEKVCNGLRQLCGIGPGPLRSRPMAFRRLPHGLH